MHFLVGIVTILEKYFQTPRRSQVLLIVSFWLQQETVSCFYNPVIFHNVKKKTKKQKNWGKPWQTVINLRPYLELKFHFNRWRKTENTDSDFSVLVKLILISEFKTVMWETRWSRGLVIGYVFSLSHCIIIFFLVGRRK